jgi:beta-lactam-binding protein with PASTA domain
VTLVASPTVSKALLVQRQLAGTDGTVPAAVCGSPLASAQKLLTDAGLLVGTTTRESSTTAPVDQVLRTEPVNCGGMASRGAVINLIASSGPSEVRVTPPCPKFLLMNPPIGPAASSYIPSLEALGFVVSRTDTESTTAATGTVITATPCGSPVAAGSTIAVSVSKQICVVPDVTGLSQANALAALAPCTGTAVNDNSSTVAKGNVIRTDPVAGIHNPVETVIEVVVSAGPVKTFALACSGGSTITDGACSATSNTDFAGATFAWSGSSATETLKVSPGTSSKSTVSVQPQTIGSAVFNMSVTVTFADGDSMTAAATHTFMGCN